MPRVRRARFSGIIGRRTLPPHTAPPRSIGRRTLPPPTTPPRSSGMISRRTHSPPTTTNVRSVATHCHHQLQHLVHDQSPHTANRFVKAVQIVGEHMTAFLKSKKLFMRISASFIKYFTLNFRRGLSTKQLWPRVYRASMENVRTIRSKCCARRLGFLLWQRLRFDAMVGGDQRNARLCVAQVAGP